MDDGQKGLFLLLAFPFFLHLACKMRFFAGREPMSFAFAVYCGGFRILLVCIGMVGCLTGLYITEFVLLMSFFFGCNLFIIW